MATDGRNETRSLIISDFRNLGVSALRKKGEDRTELKINRSLRRDELGGLVLILGNNNCGKTNVLDAVIKCNRQDFDDSRDRTDFVPLPKAPKIYMEVAGGRYHDMAAPKIVSGFGNCKVSGSSRDVLLYILRQKESFALYSKWLNGPEIDVEDYVNGNEEAVRRLSAGKDSERTEAYSYILRNRDGLKGAGIEDLVNALEEGQFPRVSDRSIEVTVRGSPIEDIEAVDTRNIDIDGNDVRVPHFMTSDHADSVRREKEKGIKGLALKAVKVFRPSDDRININPNLVITDISGGVKETEVVEDEFSSEYGYNLGGNIYTYRQKAVSNSDLRTNPSKPNEFITKVFALLGYDNETIINGKYDNPVSRVKMEKELNRELMSVSETFNRLLSTADRRYNFNIRLENTEIIMSITSGDIVINLDHQSDGFRWLFGFFINFLKSKKFVTGDIIVIDEFGGLLNFGTVAELTDILRDFGRKNGITFVIATQNPMAVDIARLDEIRLVVPRTDGGSDILNDFTQFGASERTDVLRPILSSMTVGRNFLRSERRMTVFVENYRDYFLLGGFNRMFGYDVDFIPLNGVTGQSSAKELADVMKAIERHPVMLLDTGGHDDEFAEDLKKEGVQIYTVRDMEEESVRELFAADEWDTLGLEDASFDTMACIADRLESVSDDTKANFRKFIDYISLG